MDEALGRVGKMVETNEGRIQVVQMNNTHHANVMNEVQGAITALRLEIYSARGSGQGQV